jgi:predicted ATPase/DNA-binding SARP family transcriptional activator
MAVVRLFGGVEFCGAGGATTFAGAKQRAIAARLALDPGHAVSAEQLVDAVWGEEPPPTVKASLQTHISQIRRALASIGLRDALVSNPVGYLLDIEPAAIDVHVFEQLVSHAAAEARANPQAALDVGLDAMALWTGPPLAGTGDAPYVASVLARLERRRLDLLPVIATGAIAGGRTGSALLIIEPLAAQYPYDEPLTASLARLLYADGRQVDALSRLGDLRRRLLEELGLDPSPMISELEHRILLQDPGLTSTARPNARSEGTIEFRHNLPVRATMYIEPAGRLASIGALLETRRVVTIVGPGGAGKTRTAIETAANNLERFPDGVWLVDLAAVRDPGAVVAAAAATLAVTPQEGASMLESVLEWCRGRSALLVVDNCEHLRDAAADLITAITPRCPTMSVLATSREPLGLEGEQVHVLDLLDDTTAATLFYERARLADDTFELREGDRAVVAELCDQLDHLPLAIELAAAHVRWMSPQELSSRMRDPLHAAVGTGSRARPSRHQTMRAAVAWSYELLDDSARVLFERLAVFAGAFDFAAVEAICAGDDVEERDVVVELGHLVDKSMVVTERREAGTRFRLLDTMRHFGLERLEERGQSERTRTRHMEYYAALAARADLLVRGPSELEGRRMFEDDWDNLRAAHSCAIARGDVDNAERIVRSGRLFAQLQVQAESLDWMLRTIELDTPDRHIHPEVYGGAAEWASTLGDLQLLSNSVRRGIEQAERVDHPSTALCWTQMPKLIFLDRPVFSELKTWLNAFDYQAMLDAVVAQLDTDFDWWALVWSLDAADLETPTRSARLARVVDAAARVRAPSLRAYACLYEGHHHMRHRPYDVDAMVAKYDEALTVARDMGSRHLEGECLRAYMFATVYRDDDNRSAAQICREGLLRLHETRRWDRLEQALTSAALVLARANRLEAASIVLGHVRSHEEEFGFEFSLGFREDVMRLTDAEPDRDTWLARGAAITLDEAVSYAIGQLSQPNAN